MRILAKQFYALLYDVMILIAFSMVVTAAFEWVVHFFINEQHAIESTFIKSGWIDITICYQWAQELFLVDKSAFDEAFLKSGLGKLTTVLQVTLMLCYFLYYHFSYVNGGQTIGMKSWKIKLESQTGKLKLSQTLVRFVLAWPSFFLCGLGYLSALKNEHCLSIPDKYSGTAIIYQS
ncbi:MAG: RDD family protein [Saccharospirillaceae bacterium]|nr:RDD family protein [Pseudomonadales bacterium]NRB80583.1 RDD family protein [Saccharospirillaceae bacterium]